LIIVANHLNLIDPPLLGASVPRRIYFMAKQELFRPSLGAHFVRAYGAFSVRRGELDREALRRALELLKKGQVVGMFPEGKRSIDNQLQPIQPGTSFVAVRSGAPILPVGISGSEQIKGVGFILRRPRITVTIGRPFALPAVEDKPLRSRLPEFSNMIAERVAELLPLGYRGNSHSQQDDPRSGSGD
jgi:1-acyl-sn-glycerol-3-phosphate acyltransferase